MEVLADMLPVSKHLHPPKHAIGDEDGKKRGDKAWNRLAAMNETAVGTDPSSHLLDDDADPLAKTTAREAIWQVVEGYITRWRVEDTIRHVKQSYSLEGIRLFKYVKTKAMAAIALAPIYFSMAWIGNSEKHDVIARIVAHIREIGDFPGRDSIISSSASPSGRRSWR